VLSADGIASRQEIGQDWRSRTVAWASPACELRHHHDLPIPVAADGHTGTAVGQVVGVHRARGWGGIVAWAGAELDGDGADRLLQFPDPVYFSAECDAAVRPRSAIGHDIRLRAAAITTTPARLGAEPILLLPGSLRDRGRWSLKGPAATAVDETIAQLRHRHRHRHDHKVLYVTGWREPDDEAAYYARAAAERPELFSRPVGRLEYWPPVSGSVLSVR
jgi:hypothetical protein